MYSSICRKSTVLYINATPRIKTEKDKVYAVTGFGISPVICQRPFLSKRARNLSFTLWASQRFPSLDQFKLSSPLFYLL